MSLAISGDTIAYLMGLGLSGDQMKGLIDRLQKDALELSPKLPASNEERERIRNESTYAERKRAGLERVWVYVMGVDHPDDQLVKVGISKHPNYRRETLQKERGLNLYVAHTEGPYSRSQAAEIERTAHAMLSETRERGEWFLCGVERAADVVRDCAIGASCE